MTQFGTDTRPRSEIRNEGPMGHATAVIQWTRVIRGTTYSFRRITMASGEIRFTASRLTDYNNYDARYGCAWKPAGFWTVKPEAPKPATTEGEEMKFTYLPDADVYVSADGTYEITPLSGHEYVLRHNLGTDADPHWESEGEFFSVEAAVEDVGGELA